jgi:hypothetical protein
MATELIETPEYKSLHAVYLRFNAAARKLEGHCKDVKDQSNLAKCEYGLKNVKEHYRTVTDAKSNFEKTYAKALEPEALSNRVTYELSVMADFVEKGKEKMEKLEQLVSDVAKKFEHIEIDETVGVFAIDDVNEIAEDDSAEGMSRN